MKKPLVSVIIVTHNGKHWLKKSLPTIFSQNYKNLEIIVINNNSDDGTEIFLKKYPHIKTRKFYDNEGWGVGCNRGTQMAAGKYYFFSSEDTLLAPTCLEKLVGFLETHPKASAAMANIFYYPQNQKIKSRGYFFHPSSLIISANQIYENAQDAQPIFAVSDPFLVRARDFQKTPGFDERFFLYYEDTDLCWQWWLSGREVYLVPQARQFHKVGAIAKTLPSTFLFRESVKNTLTAVIKNGEITTIILALISRIILHTLGMFIFLYRKQYAYIHATISGYWWVFTNLPKTLTERKRIQSKRIYLDNKIYHLVGQPLHSTYIQKILRGQ
ncbi:glycosyltransferase family 2 protein [Candidatus Microgenomates bacterium]|nr:MAG: glycosyltransferase family 2 protein [Candidatus Microgenomates bacterium]